MRWLHESTNAGDKCPSEHGFFLSMGGMLGTSAGARTRTWAEVNVRPRPLENRNHTLKRCHYVSDPHQQVPYQCRRHQSVATVCFAEGLPCFSTMPTRSCVRHICTQPPMCLCSFLSLHTNASPRQEFCPPPLLPLLCECCVCTHLRMSVRVLLVLCL